MNPENNKELSEENKNIPHKNKHVFDGEIKSNEIFSNNNQKESENIPKEDNFLLNKKRKKDNSQINEEDKGEIKKWKMKQIIIKNMNMDIQ